MVAQSLIRTTEREAAGTIRRRARWKFVHKIAATAQRPELAETVERALRALPVWQIVSPANLAIVTFLHAASDMDDERCDAFNEAISRQVMAQNIAAPLTTWIDGRTVLRICAISPDTSVADMSEVVAALDARAVALRAAR